MNTTDPRKDEHRPPLTDEAPFDYTRREPANWRVLVIALAVGAGLVIVMPMVYLLLRK